MKRKLILNAIDEDDILSCNICFEKFSGTGEQSPRILNCGHTYCLKCLNAMCGGRNRLECPSCRLPTKFGRGLGPASLAVNFQSVRLLEMAQSSLRSRDEILATGCVGREIDLSIASMCTDCEDGSLCAAAWGCLDCSAPLCKDCKIAHLKPKLLRHHRVVPLDDLGKQQTSTCTKHPNKEIDCVCDDCKVLVCSMDISLSHGGHKISALHEAITRERSKLKEASRTAEQLMVRVQPKVEQAKQRLVEYHADTTKMHEKIDAELAQLVDLMSRRAAAAHEEVESKVSGAVRLVDAEKDALEDWLLRASSCVKSVGRALGADEGVAAFTTCQVSKLVILPYNL